MSGKTLPIRSTDRFQMRMQSVLNSLRSSPPVLKKLGLHVLAQVRTYRKIYAGIMHGLIFWGVTIQVLGTAINLMQMQLFIPFVELTFPRNSLYVAYELIMDLAGIAILLGVGMALFRRLALKPPSLNSRWDDFYALGLLTVLPLVGLSLEATRLLTTAPPWANWSPAGSAMSSLFASLGMTSATAATLHPFLFWIHAALGLTFLASIPFTKLRHLVTVPLNILLKKEGHSGTLEKIEDLEEAEILGVDNAAEFTSLQLLSFDACTQCGRCEESCPAAISGMPYSPRGLVYSLREASHMSFLQNGNSEEELPSLSGELLQEDIAWYCTTCGACIATCPAFVNPVSEIVDLRRYQALTTGKLPKSVADTLRNVERQGNPWGMPAQDRVAWADGLDIRELAPGDKTDVLLFLGCAFAYDERNKKVARAFVKLLNNAGIDFATLGLDETCCGECARRMGHEYLFQVFAEQNIETLKSVSFNRIVTQCPHCFNSLKNEYPQMDGNFTVQHYTEFLAELDLPAGVGTNGSSRLAYHDSCYLGRYNDIYRQPRTLLERAGTKPVEFQRHSTNSFCCGGGGGGMWMETDAETRINRRRLDEALDAGLDSIATACPYCLIMFDDAARSKGISDQVQIRDIAEILITCVDKER